jgi:hypothetical protein
MHSDDSFLSRLFIRLLLVDRRGEVGLSGGLSAVATGTARVCCSLGRSPSEDGRRDVPAAVVRLG